MSDAKQIIARLQNQNFGGHGAFTVTTFKPNGDVKKIWRPIDFAEIFIEPTAPEAIAFKDAKCLIRWSNFENPNQAQAILNAIGKREDCVFYYEETTQC